MVVKEASMDVIEFCNHFCHHYEYKIKLAENELFFVCYMFAIDLSILLFIYKLIQIQIQNNHLFVITAPAENKGQCHHSY